jgi:hypothetical protein
VKSGSGTFAEWSVKIKFLLLALCSGTFMLAVAKINGAGWQQVTT